MILNTILKDNHSHLVLSTLFYRTMTSKPSVKYTVKFIFDYFITFLYLKTNVRPNQKPSKALFILFLFSLFLFDCI